MKKLLALLILFSGCSTQQPVCEHIAGGAATDKAFNECVTQWPLTGNYENDLGIIHTCQRTAYWATNHLECKGY